MVSNALTKSAGLPGSFMAAAEKASVKSISSNMPKSSLSGLPKGSTVASAMQFHPRVIQNRTGMNRQALLNKVAEALLP